jgi:peptide/nickel transport system permease protein
VLADQTETTQSPILRGLLPVRGIALALATFCGRKPLGAAGGAILLVLIVIAVLAPVISPYHHGEIHAKQIYEKPGSDFPLGSDLIGRDVLSRIFHGGRISLFVGLVSISIGITAGSLLGAISAYYGGRLDLVVQRFVDTFIAFPGIILALALMAALGSSVTNIIIALVIVLAPSAIRTVRSQALAIKEMDYVLAARAVGSSNMRIIMRHIVPNCMAIFIILATLNLGYAIIVESSLSFLGVGVPPDVPTWGSMLSEGGNILQIKNRPWLAISPGIALALAVFGVNLLGDALRDVLDPRLRGTG